MEIVEKTIEDQKVAIMNYKGSLNDMEVLIGKLSGWVEVEEIETIGDLFAIFYNNPRTVKEPTANASWGSYTPRRGSINTIFKKIKTVKTVRSK